MAKKKKIQETTIENYYDLRVDKVDELVAALKGDSTSETENTEVNYDMSANMGFDDPSHYTKLGRARKFDPYKVDKFARIPYWVKAIFVKWWFAGMVCFFVMWGVNYIDTLDALVITGAVLGIVVDVLVNPLFRYMETDRREYNSFMLFPFPFRQFWTFFTNIIYYALVLFLVGYCYTGVNELVNYIRGTVQYTYLPVEPVMFGAFSLMVDMIFIGLKDLLVYLLKKRKNKRREAVADV